MRVDAAQIFGNVKEEGVGALSLLTQGDAFHGPEPNRAKVARAIVHGDMSNYL